jgi:signal transduction histidine kinase
MIEQLLELAGARKNQTALTRNRVELAKVLQEAIAATKRDAEIAGCAVELSIPTSLPELSGDAAALRRVFQNLLTNAARHGGTGGWIGITATALNGAEPMIEVRGRIAGQESLRTNKGKSSNLLCAARRRRKSKSGAVGWA